MGLLSNACMPDYLLRAIPQVITDAQYSDFEEQSERLTGFDQSYLQLTPGPFQGRFLSVVFAPDLAVHVEHCNQALEQSVAGHPTAFTLGVVISRDAAFVLNGSPITCDTVFVSAPGQDLFLRSPKQGAILAVVVGRDRFSQSAGLSPQALDWLFASDFETRSLAAPQLARRIREDTVQAIQSACFEPPTPTTLDAIGAALLSGIAAKLSLEIAGLQGRTERGGSAPFERFRNSRRVLHENWSEVQSMDDLLAHTGGGRRSLQSAFASQLDMGPLTYHRILRLHLAKTALQDPAQFSESIGDIAAKFEFWNWSHFTSQYQSHFGELPSHTRMAAGFEP